MARKARQPKRGTNGKKSGSKSRSPPAKPVAAPEAPSQPSTDTVIPTSAMPAVAPRLPESNEDQPIAEALPKTVEETQLSMEVQTGPADDIKDVEDDANIAQSRDSALIGDGDDTSDRPSSSQLKRMELGKIDLSNVKRTPTFSDLSKLPITPHAGVVPTLGMRLSSPHETPRIHPENEQVYVTFDETGASQGPVVTGQESTKDPNSDGEESEVEEQTVFRPLEPRISHQADLDDMAAVFRTITPRFMLLLISLIPKKRSLHLLLGRILAAHNIYMSDIVYDTMSLLWRLIINVFFREISVRGDWRVPKAGDGAVIFAVGPHNNQFLDPIMILSAVLNSSRRRTSFLIAEKSMHEFLIGQAAYLMRAIPVTRAQDKAVLGSGKIVPSKDNVLIVEGDADTKFTEQIAVQSTIAFPQRYESAVGRVAEVIDDHHVRVEKWVPEIVSVSGPGAPPTSIVIGQTPLPEPSAYKVLPYVNQDAMYGSVIDNLVHGGSIAVFPEGGSHDRSELLPLKPGVAIMALHTLTKVPDLKLSIVPVGLAYFHAHRFRSRAGLDFGAPIKISPSLVRKFAHGSKEDRHAAVNSLMSIIEGSLRGVTVRAPDYDTLRAIQTARRLYRTPGQRISLSGVIQLNRMFVLAYERFKDTQEMKELEREIREYNDLLRHMRIRDHQVALTVRSRFESLLILIYRVAILLTYGSLALPGVLVNAPIFLSARFVSLFKAERALKKSTVKIAGLDVMASWKAIVALVLAPTLYTVYSLAVVLAVYIRTRRFRPKLGFLTFIALPFLSMSTIKFSEVGFDIYKSLRPLYLSLIHGSDQSLFRLRTMRKDLRLRVLHLASHLGPQILDSAPPVRYSEPNPSNTPPSLGRGDQVRTSVLHHPLTWLSRKMFDTGSADETQASWGTEYTSD